MRAPTPPTKGRGATFNPPNRFRRDEREAVDDGWGTDGTRRRYATAAEDDRPHPAGAHDHRAQRVAGHPVQPVDQSVPRLRARLHLLLRAAVARVPRPVAGARLRDQAVRQAERRRAAARGTRDDRVIVCDPLALGSNTDPYQPIEREWKVTRSLLEVLAACEHPLTIITKGALILRDLDLLASMAAKRLVRVFVSIAMLDTELARTLDPRAAAPRRRLEIVAALALRASRSASSSRRSSRSSPTRTSKRSSRPRRRRARRHAGYTLLRLPARSGAALSRVARRASPAARRARDEHRAGHPRWPRQRPALRRADARSGQSTPT